MEISFLKDHLKTLTPSDWQKLFDLLPDMESASTFGELKGGKNKDGVLVFPSWDLAPVTLRFCHTVYKLDLVPAFDWMEWKEGMAILQNNDQDFSDLDIVTLCKFFTLIIRAERFNDGV